MGFAEALPEATSLESVAIRFAGDSGDGVQLTGARFTYESARIGNDLATRPDFPAEIRAPAGTVSGVSAFQIHFGSTEIFTAGDRPDVLVAMNPAALKANIADLRENGILICNADSFTEKNLARVGFEENPLESEDLATRFNLVSVPITTLTLEAVSEVGLAKSASEKCKNFFALGVVCFLYSRGIQETLQWIERKFAKKPEVAEANRRALEGGLAFAQASELFPSIYEVTEAKLPPGTYRNVTGNQGLAFGLLAASQLSGLKLFYAGYPITPASEVLHEVSRYKEFGAVTLQAEDEIAACCSAIGASYGGALGVTASSGPGILLKQEAIGLAATAELPLVIVNVQRAGPSTGMPTKTEQSDLLQVLFGRNGECPVAVVAIASPDDAFDATVEACRIALEHMTPVFLLSDGYVGNGSQPWRIPAFESLKKINPPFLAENGTEDFAPYRRDEKFVRAWALPGTHGREHRIGGLEKEDVTGQISYDPENHQRMTNLRQAKIDAVAKTYAPLDFHGDESGDVLVIGWGGTSGALSGAVQNARSEGVSVSRIHLRHLNPLHTELPVVMKRFKEILVPELNTGQLRMILRAKFMADVHGLNKVQGQPFRIEEVHAKIVELAGK